MNEEFIRQSTYRDIGVVASFLDTAMLLHRHLDWRPIMDWIDKPPFLLLYSNEKLKALLSCAPDPSGVAWIHCFGVEQSISYHDKWNALLSSAKQDQSLENCTLCAVGLHDWFIKLLESSNFSMRQNIVVLSWDGKLPKPLPLLPDVFIRPMVPTDLDQVAELDTGAFEPIWVMSRETLEQAYNQSEHSSVAEIDNKVIGYEISTANHFSAHLARLAVEPGHLHKNIGFSLVLDMLYYYSRRGIRKISVNTQDNNIASIALYKKIGFIQTEESFPVYCLKI